MPGTDRPAGRLGRRRDPGRLLDLTDPAGAAGAATPVASEELVDWIDEHGAVLGQVTRRRMRAERLRHRAVYVVVIDDAERVVVHQRADWKDVWPSAWDLAFGGVVGAGEGWEPAARRELREEAGVLDGRWHCVEGEFGYDDDAVALVGRLWVVRTDAPITPLDGEVQAVDRVALAELGDWVARHDVCPDSARCVLPAVIDRRWERSPSSG